jgi:hypothetical protein
MDAHGRRQKILLEGGGRWEVGVGGRGWWWW